MSSGRKPIIKLANRKIKNYYMIKNTEQYKSKLIREIHVIYEKTVILYQCKFIKFDHQIHFNIEILISNSDQLFGL